jgi:hypothetical protein
MNQLIHSIQNILFDIALVMWFVLLMLTYFNIFESAPYYLEWINTIIKLYISLFLLWRFNDFRKVKFTNLDKKVIFNGALYLFFSTVFVKIIINKLVSAETEAHNFLIKYVDAH